LDTAAEVFFAEAPAAAPPSVFATETFVEEEAEREDEPDFFWPEREERDASRAGAADSSGVAERTSSIMKIWDTNVQTTPVVVTLATASFIQYRHSRKHRQ
jgi:hypothetical protein